MKRPRADKLKPLADEALKHGSIRGRFVATCIVMEKIRKRFFAKVEKTSGCWLWNAGTFTDGYGKFKIRIDGKPFSVRAHRLSLAWSMGLVSDKDLPEGVVMHKCDRRRCVRPSHLSIGTVQDNTNDCSSKGRRVYSHGERNGQSKLTDEEIREIRASDEPSSALALKYDVRREHVWRIRTGKRWARS